MHSIRIQINTRTAKGFRSVVEDYTLPEKPEELTARQMRIIARCVAYAQLHQLSAIELNSMVLQALLKMRDASAINGSHIRSMMALLEFLTPDKFTLRAPITKWSGPFKAPRRNMSRFIGHQLELCDTILQAIAGTKAPTDLLEAQFCAAYTTLMGMPWSISVATYLGTPYFRYIARRSTRQAMIIEYKSQRRIFTERYPNAFDSAGTTAQVFPSLGWPGTIVRLAGDKFGHPDRVRRTKAHEIFAFLEINKRDFLRAQQARN